MRALDEAQRALIFAGIEFLVMGGSASAVWGRPRLTRDVDLFVRPEDTGEALTVLTEAEISPTTSADPRPLPASVG